MTMMFLQVVCGEKLIEQGDDGDNFYVIERYVHVYVPAPGYLMRSVSL